MFLWCKNSAFQVMTNTKPTEGDSSVLSLQCGRAMTVYGQILLRDHEAFEVTGVEAAHLQGLQAEWIRFDRQGCVLFNDGIPYPDRLLPDVACSVKAQVTQGIWITVQVPAEAKAGTAAFDVVCHTSAGDFTARILLKIYEVTLPKPAEGALDMEYFFGYADLGASEPFLKIGCETWWSLMLQYARTMKQLRFNSLALNPFPLLAGGSRRCGTTSWSFDFTLLDRFTELFLREGSFRRLVISSPLASLTGETICSFDEAGNKMDLPLRTPEGEAYSVSLLQALYAHFEQKGWLPMMVMHLCDEPHETENWLWFRKLVRQNMPGVPCAEPLDMIESALALENECDIFVPRLNVYDEEKAYFERRQKAGDTVWCYTCCYPEEPWYLNRFIDQPARYTRLLKWGCFANGITGFLHWGFNRWHATPSVYGLNSEARFKGDSFVVYPDDENNTLLLSNRALATVEGVQEYELLALAARRHPEAAKALARSLVRSFSDFTDDAEKLEAAHSRLLALAEDACRG